MTRYAPIVWNALAWAWALLAGGGGLVLLVTRGPWPLTNGWFALFSGLSICPAVEWLFRKYGRVQLTWPVRIALAVMFFVAGRIALLIP